MDVPLPVVHNNSSTKESLSHDGFETVLIRMYLRWVTSGLLVPCFRYLYALITGLWAQLKL